MSMAFSRNVDEFKSHPEDFRFVFYHLLDASVEVVIILSKMECVLYVFTWLTFEKQWLNNKNNFVFSSKFASDMF
jgi:hypothetical protein